MRGPVNRGCIGRLHYFGIRNTVDSVIPGHAGISIGRQDPLEIGMTVHSGAGTGKVCQRGCVANRKGRQGVLQV